MSSDPPSAPKSAARPRLRAPTAHDVARLAGVSQSAVSRAFTPGASVSADTRERVSRAAAELGYRPNLFARSLIKRESSLVGVVIPDLVNPFYAALLERLSAELRALGYRVLLFNTRLSEDADPVLDEVLNYQVAALILVSSTLKSGLADECRRIGLPVVQLNRVAAGANVSSVVGDNAEGARTIAKFLVAGGHQRIAFMAGLDTSSTNREREDAFVAALHEEGVALHARVSARYSPELAREAARELLSSPTPPDAIFCANDHMAIPALSVARHEFRLAPGADISIIGFDDAPLSAWPEISLTTYRQPFDEMAVRAVEIVARKIQHEALEPSTVVLQGELIVRGSARRPAGVVDRDGGSTWPPKV